MGKILCYLGFHSWEMIGLQREGFGIYGYWMSTFRCKRCGSWGKRRFHYE
jgi:hypothetical protein